MNKLMLVVMLLALGVLSGCASDGNNATVRSGTGAGGQAAQSSAQTIAPITSYIGGLR